MKLSNQTYDFLKWFALVAIPAAEALWLTVGKVWGLPYLTEIGATIAAIGLFIAALIGASTTVYRADTIQNNFNTDAIDELIEGADYEETIDTTEEQ